MYLITLTPFFFISGPELEEQKLLILRKEIQLHVCLSGLTHEADQLKLQRCLRSQLKSSAEAAIILEQSRALQVPRTHKGVSDLKTQLDYSILYHTIKSCENSNFCFLVLQN